MLTSLWPGVYFYNSHPLSVCSRAQQSVTFFAIALKIKKKTNYTITTVSSNIRLIFPHLKPKMNQLLVIEWDTLKKDLWTVESCGLISQTAGGDFLDTVLPPVSSVEPNCKCHTVFILWDVKGPRLSNLITITMFSCLLKQHYHVTSQYVLYKYEVTLLFFLFFIL